MLTDGAESGTTSPPLLDTCPIDDESPTTDVLYCRYRRAPSVPASSFVRPSLVTCLAPESFKGAGTTVSEYTNAANASTATPTGPTSQGHGIDIFATDLRTPASVAAPGRRSRRATPVPNAEWLVPLSTESTSRFNRCRSTLISAALWYRKLRSFSSAFRMMLSSSAGSSRFQLAAGTGASFRIADRMTPRLSPRNGKRPVAISYRTTPNENRSVRPSSSLPRTCSGDM